MRNSDPFRAALCTAAAAHLGHRRFALVTAPDGVAQVVPDEEAVLIPPEVYAQAELAAAKLEASRKVTERRDAIFGGGYLHNFGAAAGQRRLDQRNEADLVNWLGLSALADTLIADGKGDAILEVRDAANETFATSAQTTATALRSMAVWRTSVLSRTWSLKDAIAAARDVQTLEGLDLSSGWPA